MSLSIIRCRKLKGITCQLERKNIFIIFLYTHINQAKDILSKDIFCNELHHTSILFMGLCLYIKMPFLFIHWLDMSISNYIFKKLSSDSPCWHIWTRLHQQHPIEGILMNCYIGLFHICVIIMEGCCIALYFASTNRQINIFSRLW